MSSKIQNLIEKAKRTEDLVMVLVEGDWIAVRYVSNAYDGSPYGTTAFADHDNMALPDDMIEDIREPNPDEEEYIPSNQERYEEAVQHEKDRLEGIRLDELRAKREATRKRRTDLEERYREASDKDPSGMTMRQMRDELMTISAESSIRSLSKFMDSIGGSL